MEERQSPVPPDRHRRIRPHASWQPLRASRLLVRRQRLHHRVARNGQPDGHHHGPHLPGRRPRRESRSPRRSRHPPAPGPAWQAGRPRRTPARSRSGGPATRRTPGPPTHAPPAPAPAVQPWLPGDETKLVLKQQNKYENTNYNLLTKTSNLK